MKEIVDFHYFGLQRFDQFAMKGTFRMFQFSNFIIVDSWKRMPLNIASKYFLKKIAHIIAIHGYDWVNVIGNDLNTAVISVLLKKNHVNVLHSIHEVCRNHLTRSQMHPICSYLLQNDIPLNLFSKKSEDDLLHFLKDKRPVYSVIPFSLFTGYQEFPISEICELKGEDDYVLFYGYIADYKGLDILYEASKLLRLRELRKKIVVAGFGKVDYLDIISRDENFILINRFLNNHEITDLIRRCHVVVCPYRSSSQTGITQTVFNFRKPIVATRVPAFTSTIEDRKTGLLVDVEDAEQLTDAIHKSYNGQLYSEMCDNISRLLARTAQDWIGIAGLYEIQYIIEPTLKSTISYFSTFQKYL
ncbi:MAG: glycosyltransferase [Bacteroides intestinalis]|nr:glycosyltransferase [Bacteroides intestinalis]